MDISTNINKQHADKIHPTHRKEIIRRAVKNLRGGVALFDKWVDLKEGYQAPRLPDDHQEYDNNIKLSWR